MKFSEQWLRSWVNPDITTQQLVDQITMAGLEVDSVEPAAGEFSEVVVARVESVEKHPDAKKLNVCQVSDGKQSLQIVCGAANVREGLMVPLAKIGAVLPGDFEIKPAKLRGVESSGMLCSEKELGLADQAEGLMELADDAPLGKSLRDYLELNDQCIEVDLTPNRGDCLSIAGIAREVGTLNNCEVNERISEPYKQTLSDTFSVKIKADKTCTHYAGRVVRGIDPGAKTPMWMVERLRRSGIRSLGAVVDITNYIMLELGQPMHAFDLDELHGKINVRFAKKAEQITLLDGKTLKLDTESLLIADDKRPLALAGIMGGEGSGVSDNTRNVFLESAFFVPQSIAGKARQYGLHTDSSHRFERGVDPQLQVFALDRATELMLSICGGEVGPVVEVTTDAHVKEIVPIQLRRDRIPRVLGIELDDSEVVEILQRLGMEVKSYTDGWLIKPPSFRFDIAIEADLLEELVRIYGYNNIPRTMPHGQVAMQAESERRTPLSVIQGRLIERGYFEAITYSFVDPKWQRAIDPDAVAVTLANPLSSEMSVMRSSLWPGLLQALQHNLNRQHQRIRLFESGLCFRQIPEASLQQVNMLAGVVYGEVEPEQWGVLGRKVDFFDIKADVESLLSLSELNHQFSAESHPALHPGQSARISRDGQDIGWIGALHPALMSKLDIEAAAYLFELDMDAVLEAGLPQFHSLSRFPEVRRDLAIVVENAVSAQDIVSCVHDVSTELLQSVQIFDIYTGKGIEEGRKSVALGLILQDFSRTLTDQDVELEVQQIVSALKSRLAATLRE